MGRASGHGPVDPGRRSPGRSRASLGELLGCPSKKDFSHPRQAWEPREERSGEQEGGTQPQNPVRERIGRAGPDEASTWPPGAPGLVLGGQRPTSRVVPVLEVPPALPRSQQPSTVQTVACTAHPRVPGRQVWEEGVGLGGPRRGDVQKCWWGQRRRHWSPEGGSSDLLSSVHTTERKRGKKQTEVHAGPFAA